MLFRSVAFLVDGGVAGDAGEVLRRGDGVAEFLLCLTVGAELVGLFDREAQLNQGIFQRRKAQQFGFCHGVLSVVEWKFCRPGFTSESVETLTRH